MKDGILSGLAVIGILWLVKLIWEFVISPTINRFTYHGVKIEGEWISEFGNQTELPYKEKIILQRNGLSVEGEIECIECGPTKEDLGKKYKLKGQVVNNFLLCTYTIESGSLLDLGCFCLRVVEGGNSLKGYCISYQHPSDTLKPLDYIWHKQPDKNK